MEEIRIRKATIEDLPRVRYVTRQAYKIPIRTGGFVTRVKEPNDLARQLEERKMDILVAEFDGKIVGSVRYQADKDSIYIFKLAVLKTYRKQGAAARLMAQLEENAIADGFGKLKLDCAEEKGLPEYYKKLGFKVHKVIDHGFYHGVYMHKIIAKKA
jgi:ribosomal protein S18 acetylase RimI-like enzyme